MSTKQSIFPTKDGLYICFSHVSYQLAQRFEPRKTDIRFVQAKTADELTSVVGEVDVLVISGLWRDGLLDLAPKLKFVQSISAGYDQYPLDRLRRRGIRLASARGVNRNAVSEHVLATMLAFARHLHVGRDNQRRGHWRGMLPDLTQREQELCGATLLIIGLGHIGSRIARLAKAFEMRVLATKRDLSNVEAPVDEVRTPDVLHGLLPEADFVVLTCPLTEQTKKIIDRTSLSRMKESAFLINAARGQCVDEEALLEALRNQTIAGAGLDCFWEEPLSPDSPFWHLDNVLLTPHTAGETRRYEDNVLDILMENLKRLWRGETKLLNQIV
ncbi:D-2-hydroxyacid dehydrogenase [bacterium]|nr:D-2-hydroxyacid dehydrogenase [bacterium]